MNLKQKKRYVKPQMSVVEMECKSNILQSSDYQENPYWKDEQPDPDDWWKP